MRKLAYLFHTSYNNWLMRRQTRHNGNKTSLFFCILSFDSLQHAFHVSDAFSIGVKVARPTRDKKRNFRRHFRRKQLLCRGYIYLCHRYICSCRSYICSCRGYICSCHEQFVRAVAIFVHAMAIFVRAVNNLFVPSLYLFVPWQFVCVVIPVGHRMFLTQAHNNTRKHHKPKFFWHEFSCFVFNSLT